MKMMTDHVVKQLLKGGPNSQAKFKEYLRLSQKEKTYLMPLLKWGQNLTLIKMNFKN